MDAYEFLRNLTRYYELKGKKEAVSRTEELERRDLYQNLRNYVADGQELIDLDLEQIPEIFFSGAENAIFLETLESQLDKIRREIKSKSGRFVENIQRILD